MQVSSVDINGHFLVCYTDLTAPGAGRYFFRAAGVAQLAEQLTCNQQVGGSIPFASSSGRTS